MAVKGGQQPRGGTGPSCGSRSALMMTVLACFVHSTQSTTFMDDAEERPARRLLASGEEFAMQQPQFITRPAGAPGVPLMKAAVNGKPVYYFQPSQSIASSSLGTPPTYVIDPRILRKAQLNTLRARVNHARNRAQVQFPVNLKSQWRLVCFAADIQSVF